MPEVPQPPLLQCDLNCSNVGRRFTIDDGVMPVSVILCHQHDRHLVELLQAGTAAKPRRSAGTDGQGLGLDRLEIQLRKN